MAETNPEFAKKVGCHYTMASRMRNGERLPSAKMLFRIVDAYGLSLEEARAAYSAGPQALGKYLRRHIFDAA